MELTGRVGPATAADGITDVPRLGRTLAQAVTDAHGKYHDAVVAGRVFSLYLGTTATGIAQGHDFVNSVAGSAVQFALWNPVGSPVALSILRVGVGIASGTPAGGAVFHAMSWGNSITVANSVIGPVNHKFGTGGTQAGYIAIAAQAGTVPTGAKIPVGVRDMPFASVATAAASVNYVKAVDDVGGDLVLFPGAFWVPMHRGVGTAMLHSYSVTWEELPL